MNRNIAMVPGSFDPPTNGHMDMFIRAAALYDKVYVVVSDNLSKTTLFSAQERKDILVELLRDYGNIEVRVWDRLVVEFAREFDVGVIIRGVRAMNDFGYEFELALTYKQLNPDIEVLFMPTNPKYFLIRSSTIKELTAFGADISKMVPDLVDRKVKNKLMC